MEKAQRIFDLAILAEEAGQASKALKLYKRASELAKESAAPRLRWASLLYGQGRWKDSIKVARQITRHWPKASLAYSIIGESYSELGHLLRAERAFRQSLSVKPRPETWVFLSSVLARLGREDESEACLRSALALDPQYEEAHYNLGFLHKLRGENAPAERHLRRAIKIDPKYALAYAELGFVLLRRKDRVKEAIGLLKKSIANDPEYAWSRVYLANALWRLRKLKAADEQYRKCIELWPDGSLPYWCYGDFLACEGKGQAVAEKYLRKALEIEPKSKLTNYHLGKHLLQWGRKEEAVRLLKKAARLGHPLAEKRLEEIKKGNRSRYPAVRDGV